MTFLQPLLLWGLPLILLPVLIHLFNRLRHRSMPWAAMMFLRSATRKSTRYARLRQFLILMFRVLAVLGLVLALSRPLAGGWAGWALSGAPDAILLLFDRSASMDVREGEISKREQATRLLSQAAAKYEEASRILMLDSTTAVPQEIANAATLPELPVTRGTDTATDVPGMLQSALDWLTQTKPGSAEIWVASDLQESNWDSTSERWSGLASGLAALPQRVRLRLLALNSEPALNNSVVILDALARHGSQRSELEIVLEVARSSSSPSTLPLTINVDGSLSQVDLRFDGPTLRYRHKVPLNTRNAGGWGYVELPADSNLRDNRSYFVYRPPTALRAAVVASDPAAGKLLQLAAAPDPSNTNQICDLLETNAVESANLDNYALILWQAPLPQGAAAARLRAFTEGGGALSVFPSGEPSQFGDIGFGEVQSTAVEKPFKISRWEERDGPLASTAEGLSLPVGEVQVLRRQQIVGDATILASFEDGAPFLTRRFVGKGQVLFCATQAGKEWSDFYEGVVLVPMLQRLMESGGRRFAMAASVECGDWQPAENERWTSVDSNSAKDISTQSGVYRAGTQLIAVNRPAREDDWNVVDPSRAKALLGQVPVHLFEEKESGAARIQAELWRLFLVIMALCLIVEAILILPEKPEKVREFETPAPPRERVPEMAEAR